MIILDTNVLSELTKPKADQAVVAWLNARPADELAVTAVTTAEMLAGAMVLDGGKRKRQLLEVMLAALRPFEPTMLAFDSAAALHFADLIALRRRVGKPIGSFDAQIAAIALAQGAAIATRDVKDFSGMGLDLINPWTA